MQQSFSPLKNEICVKYTDIITLKQAFYQNSNFAVLYLILPNPSIQI